MDLTQFRQSGHDFIDWIAEYLETIEKRSVRSSVKPGEVASHLPLAPPEAGESIHSIFNDFNELILPGITHWQHPGWFAYFPANNSPESVLAELLTAGLGVQGMSLADLAGRDRAGGKGPRVAAADDRPARGLLRRHPGHGLDGHPVRPALGPGEGHRIRGQRDGPRGSP